MKKIVFVIESLHIGGAEKSLVTLLQNLDYKRYDVDLITFQKGGIFFEIVPKEVNRILIKLPMLSLFDRLKFAIKRNKNSEMHGAQLFWPIIKKYLKKHPEKYYAAIAYNQGFSTYFTAEFIVADTKYAWLNTDYQKAGYQTAFDYPIYEKFNKVIVVSAEAKESFNIALRNIGKKVPIEVIKDITDKKNMEVQACRPLKTKFRADTINILSVGRLVAPKGFTMAVSACHLLRSKGHNINWYILGEGTDRKKLEQQINTENLQESFFLLGADKNPYPYMKACDIYVQTSLFEGLGLTVIEASYLNKPIVCTNFPTVHGILKEEETGLIAEMNAESIAAQIERLILDEELRESLTTNLSRLKNTDMEESLRNFNNLIRLDH